MIPLDVGKTESVQAAAEASAALCDHIDLLVSCAGISGGETYEKMRAVFNINTLGAVRMTEAFLPLMQTGMKRLAFVSSEAGRHLACTPAGYFHLYHVENRAQHDCAADVPHAAALGLYFPAVSSRMGALLYDGTEIDGRQF